MISAQQEIFEVLDEQVDCSKVPQPTDVLSIKQAYCVINGRLKIPLFISSYQNGEVQAMLKHKENKNLFLEGMVRI